MSAREHSRFVHFVLPWIVAVAGLVLYLVTLNHWVGFSSVDVVSKVASWDWNTMQLGPVTLVVTWPVRWMPVRLQPIGLNILSAVLAAGSLGLLAKSIALLPHDRTREQRQREHSDFGFMTASFAWIPPVAGVAMLGFQRTFWEHATSMTGEMITLFLFAFCVFAFLRFRVMQEDGWLACLAFAYAAAAANDWGMIGFGPLFLFAVLWAKGVAFFDGSFLIRTTLAGLAGLLFYLVQPLALRASGQVDGTFLELLRSVLGIQKQILLQFPRVVLLFCCLGSVLPAIFMGIRWPSTFRDMSAAGSIITNAMFRIVHLAFLGFGVWVMFDPPFSPRELGYGLPFLHLYYLTALVIGYTAGYVVLVFGQDPDRKVPRPTDRFVFGQRLIAGLGGIAPLAAAAGLAVYSLPTIRSLNGPLVREMAETLVTVSEERPALVSDDNSLLMLAMGIMAERGQGDAAIPVFTPMLERHGYQRHHEKKYGDRWPALAVERLPDPLPNEILLRQMVALAYSNRLHYLHPSFGYYFEPFYLFPTNTVYGFGFQSTNSWVIPPVSDAVFDATNARWEVVRDRVVENPALARLRRQKGSSTTPVAAHYSRAFNTWGVQLQKRGRIEPAGRFFEAAVQLNKDNLAATINARFNAGLRSGKREAVVLDKELNDQLGRYRDLPSFLSLCGPVDDPAFCQRLGRVFAEGNLYRQACQQFARSLELQPDSAEARIAFANAAMNGGFHPEALRMAGELRQPGSSLTQEQLMEVYRIEAWAHRFQGELVKSEQVLNEAQKQFPDLLRPAEILTEIYISANQTNAALAVSDRIIAQRPGDARPLVNKAAIQMQMGQFTGALTNLNAALEKDAASLGALKNRANCNHRLGHFEDAERDYKRLLELAPKMSTVYYHLGEVDFLRGNLIEAKRNYRKFLETSAPGTAEALAAQKQIDQITAGKGN